MSTAKPLYPVVFYIFDALEECIIHLPDVGQFNPLFGRFYFKLSGLPDLLDLFLGKSVSKSVLLFDNVFLFVVYVAALSFSDWGKFRVREIKLKYSYILVRIELVSEILPELNG